MEQKPDGQTDRRIKSFDLFPLLAETEEPGEICYSLNREAKQQQQQQANEK